MKNLLPLIFLSYINFNIPANVVNPDPIIVKRVRQNEKVQMFEVSLFNKRTGYEYDLYGKRTGKETMIYSLMAINNYPKKIRNFRGTITISDLYGEKIKIFRVDYNELYQKNLSAKQKGSVNMKLIDEYKEVFDPQNPRDKKIYDIDLSQCNITWKTEYIHFSDGTEIYRDEYIPKSEWRLR